MCLLVLQNHDCGVLGSTPATYPINCAFVASVLKREKASELVWYEVRLSVMSETSKHLRCLFSTEVTIQQIYKDYVAGSIQLDIIHRLLSERTNYVHYLPRS